MTYFMKMYLHLDSEHVNFSHKQIQNNLYNSHPADNSQFLSENWLVSEVGLSEHWLLSEVGCCKLQ